MRRIVTAITAVAMAFSLIAQASPAAAHLPGYESEWRLQTQYETARPGDTQTTLVQFINTGTTTWTKGTSTQVDLAVCLPKPDDNTCDVASPLASWAVNWLSATRYATQTEAVVAPGGIANFTYTYKVPAGTAAGFYTFNGDLVVSSIGGSAGRLHPRGYFHQVQVLGDAAASCTPTAITTSPTFAQNQVGANHTQTVTVTCDPATTGGTRPGAANAEVTFIIDAGAGDTGNADLTRTAVTDANGVASVSYTRANPGTDTISAFPTAQPAVRATATKRWTVAAAVITCTPTTAATQQQDSLRTYTVTLRSSTTGAVLAGQPVDVTVATKVTAGSGTFTGNGTSTYVNVDAGTTVRETNNTDANGVATFTVTGNSNTVTPRVFFDEGTPNNTLDATEFRADCGAVTFAGARATITVTPDTAATNATGGSRVYSITATDQFGQPFTGAVRISFSELKDLSTATTSSAVINLTQAGGTAPTTPAGSANCGGITANDVTLTLGATGTGFFSICAAGATSGTPIVWQDVAADGIPQTDEPQDTGGTKTWTAAAVTSVTVTPASATNPTSTGGSGNVNDNSFGEERYTLTFRDQSGNAIIPTGAQTVNFTIQNTGANTLFITELCGVGQSPTIAVAAGATSQQTCNVSGASSTSIEIDAEAAGGATVTGTVAGSGLTGSGTKTWVLASEEPAGTPASATGTVTGFDKTADFYLINTTVGTFRITYAAGDTFTVNGTTTDIATFETNLTVGDAITWTRATGGETHALTNQ